LPREIRPLVRHAQPLARDLAPAVTKLTAVLPDLTRVLQVADYGLNEIGYNPDGKDEGILFWLAWTLNNWGSLSNTADAHGSILRASLFLECSGVTQPINLGPLYAALLGTANVCPAERP
jgi:phospholipid/cholesterol/gamma-HCH transport system substrate-binding protein